MTLLNDTSKAIVFLLAFLLLPISASALTTLPDPTNIYDGLPAAIQYDEFYSYNLWLLNDLATSGPTDLEGSPSFTQNAGVGGQDIVLYTQAGGTSNLGIGPSGNMDFEDPVDTNTGVADGAAFEGWWGQDDQNNDSVIDNVNGSVTVGSLLDYLHAYNPLNNIPVFIFDTNQTGSQRWMYGAGQAFIIDADNDEGGGIIESWSFDTHNDGIYNPDPLVFIPGEYDFTGASGTPYQEQFSGSGFADYAFYAPTMKLSLYDPDDTFVVQFEFDYLNNGGEEFFLTGFTQPSTNVPVPEPSSIILIGAGLVGLAFYRKKRK